jgi:hypothetical protein
MSDTAGQARSAVDARPQEEQPGIGELRLDPLVNEWIAMAAHRQGRIFLPPKELCPLCPTTGELLTEIPESDFEVVVFDNRSPSLRPPVGDWALPDIVGPQNMAMRSRIYLLSVFEFCWKLGLIEPQSCHRKVLLSILHHLKIAVKKLV